MTDKPMTFREFFKDKIGITYGSGFTAMDVCDVWHMIVDVSVDYMEYRVDLKLKELENRDRSSGLQD